MPSDNLSGILSKISTAILFDMSCGIQSDILFDIYYIFRFRLHFNSAFYLSFVWHIFWQCFCSSSGNLSDMVAAMLSDTFDLHFDIPSGISFWQSVCHFTSASCSGPSADAACLFQYLEILTWEAGNKGNLIHSHPSWQGKNDRKPSSQDSVTCSRGIAPWIHEHRIGHGLPARWVINDLEIWS